MSTTTALHSTHLGPHARTGPKTANRHGWLRRFLDGVVAARQVEAERIVARYLAEVARGDVLPPGSPLARRRGM